jgi:hypothetical protein
VSLLIKEYLDYYRMEYTLSVYMPEAALQNEPNISREELAQRSGLNQVPTQEPLLVKMLKQIKSGAAQASSAVAKPKQQEEVKRPQNSAATNKNIFYKNQREPHHGADEDDGIREEIVEEIEEATDNQIAQGRQ